MTRFDLERIRHVLHTRVDERVLDIQLEIQAQAKAARASIDRRVGQRIRRLEDRVRSMP